MTTKINADTNGLTESVDTSGILEIQTNSNAAVIIGADQNANFCSTGAIIVPNGTTAQRPTPVNGMMRYNSNVAVFEVYANNSWAAANVTPAPTNTVAPVISGSAIVGQNLTCTTGTWSGSPSTFFYQWRANSTAISNATANVFTLTINENGANITCNVIAQNIAGNSSPATSNTLGPVIEGITVSYLVVAGGGGGGYAYGGGGGAGGLLSNTATLSPGTTYTITVGSGGSGGATQTAGANSSISGAGLSTITSIGGGRGGSAFGIAPTSGGSGGGGGAGNNGADYSTGASGTSGQGNAGGNGVYGGSGETYTSGGGGGSSAVGANGNGNNQSGAGGNGTSSSITGSAVTYAGGGGGGGYSVFIPVAAGSGGTGGGGAGGYTSGQAGTAGTINTGGGGGGGAGGNGNGGAGGSGIVIISYAGAQQFGGGVITTAGGNTIHTFTSSGSLLPLTALSASYLVVAGGGGGGSGSNFTGGGGAGGFLSGSNVTIDSNSIYAVTVGSGGAVGSNGTISSFGALSNAAVGGGAGGADNASGFSGGSGGGGGRKVSGSPVGGNGTSGQGNAGGSDLIGLNSAGGGGGASAVGGNTNGSHLGGAGGNGTSSSITGSAVTYAGGGGGGCWSGGTGTPAPGGSGGGGAGAGGATASAAGTANTGGGGGGGGSGGGASAGGSGVVIVSYPGATQKFVGGNVTTASNNTIHTFNSSGTLQGNTTYGASFNGSSQFLYLGGQNNFAFGSGNFTVEMWIRPTSTSAGVLYDSRPTSTNGLYPMMYFDTNVLYYYVNGNNEITVTGISTGVWTHIALVKNSGSTRIYVNGVQAGGTYSDGNTYLNGADRPMIGRGGFSSTGFVNGLISNLRVVKGTAVYTANFTPPRSPLTAISGTELLTLQSSTIVDNSTNAFTITNSGSVATLVVSPFFLN